MPLGRCMGPGWRGAGLLLSTGIITCGARSYCLGCEEVPCPAREASLPDGELSTVPTVDWELLGSGKSNNG